MPRCPRTVGHSCNSSLLEWRGPHLPGISLPPRTFDPHGNCKEDDEQSAGQEGRNESSEDCPCQEGGTPAGAAKPIKTAFNKSSLIVHLAESSGIDGKSVKAVVAALEAAMLASVHKKGLGSFTLPGLLKVNVINVPAKKKRTGLDPFTKVERVFAAKPATVKIKTRALKKLKDAAL